MISKIKDVNHVQPLIAEGRYGASGSGSNELKKSKNTAICDAYRHN
jgi:hypothetical protein